ncbi:TolC family protein [Litoricolaceae bacterium]|nr:TolC family protein [Litorivicinaceae bacterium]
MRLSKIKVPFIAILIALVLPIKGHALTLSEAHIRLIENDPEILRSEVTQQIAQTRRDQAVSELFPKVTTVLSTSRNSRKQYGEKDRYQGEDYSLIISQPLYNQPLWLEPDRRAAIIELREAAAEEVRQKRRSELVSAYVQWIESEVRQQLIQRRLEAVIERYNQVEELFEKQRLSVTQLLTVENERDRVKAELARARSSAIATQSALKSLIGQDVESPLNRESLLIGQWPLDTKILSMAEPLGDLHPLVDQALAQREAASVSLRQAETQWMPRVDARLQLRHTNIGASESETFPVESSSAQITMTWDLYDSGAKDASLREAELSMRDADLALRQAERDVERQKMAASLDINRYREAWNAAFAEYESAKKLVTAANRSFDLGVGTVGDSLRALERLIDAESRLTSRWLEALLGVAQIGRVNNRLTSELIDTLSVRFIQ